MMFREDNDVPIIVRIDRVIADRKISQTVLAKRIGISLTNLTRIVTGKVLFIRFSTLEALCRELRCQPGDLLEYKTEEQVKDLFL